MLRTAFHSRRRFAGAILIAFVIAVCIVPALAGFPWQRTTLSGPAIGSLIPVGEAQLNQAAQPRGPGTLVVRLTNLNLPDSTLLNVSLDRRPVGVLVVVSGNASEDLTVPFQAGRLSRLAVTLNDGTTILSGKTPWTVPWPTTP
jgi:hypothetical protein